MNVLIILVDALRPDHLACYGYPKDTCPNIDRLAREGVRFDKCMSVSTHTFPPIVSILTGQNVATHGMVTAHDYGDWIVKDTWKDRRTPLHVLEDAGYLVDGEAVMRWKPLGFKRDKDDLVAYLPEVKYQKFFYFASPYATHLPYNPPQEYYEMFVDKDFEPTEETLKRMDVARHAMICRPPGIQSAMEVGQPDVIDIPDEAHQRSVDIIEFKPEDAPGIRALYDGEVRLFDDWLGKSLVKLEELGLLDDTLVILVSDHGEELLERGHIGHTSCNLMGTVNDECVMVPLIMRYPKKIPAGTVVKNQVSQIDILPTIFDILELENPLPVDGASLVPLIKGETDQHLQYAYAAVPPAGWQRLIADKRIFYCVRTLEWKLILKLDHGSGERTYELYDLTRDPGEKNNVIDEHPDKADELKAKLDPHLSAGATVLIHK